MSEKLTVECLGWRPLRRNTLVGFAQVHIAELRLTVSDIAIHEKAGSRWAALPGKPILSSDGTAQRDQATNKIRYVTILEFDNAAVRSAFSAAVVNAVIEAYPDALTEPAEATS